MGERRFWMGRAEPQANAQYGAFSYTSGGNFESLTVHDSFSVSFQPIPFKVGDWTARPHFFSRLRYQQDFSATTVPYLDTRSHHQPPA